MHSLLVTVGTSLFSNAQRALGKSAGEITDAQFAHYLHQSPPEEASAETNSIARLLRLGIVAEGDRLLFLHSQTEEGRRCAELLQRNYQKTFQVEKREINDLTYTESRFKMRGLRSLVAHLIEIIQTERNQERSPLINATGGFKAEIAYATLIGLLFHVPVYYIHEKFGDIVEMPTIPIAWDYSLFADHRQFFQWIGSDYRLADEVEQRLRGLPSEARLLLSEEDGYIALSPAGEAFYAAFEERRARVHAVPLLASARALEAWNALTPDERQIVADYLDRLRLPEWRHRNSEQPSNSDCFVAPRGHISWRILFYELHNGALCILEITRHDRYEQLLARGVFRKQYQEFTPLHIQPFLT